MKLLIVDDNAAMRHLMRRLTCDLMERIEECADGAEALAVYERHNFGADDWVLMDFEMPGLDGIRATEQLCARHPEARVLIVTRYDDEALRRRLLAGGAYGFIHKDNLLELRTVFDPAH
ncbi:MAG TPA: response regulator transcription factor [Blastocatellia bacterium]|nr:response regulator transcription factor [Blastocatellia bacterium]HMX25269.1 response regulator transcription factor [Blastocatellia bacterium]HMZ22334.1 response regulator transcription factor [Blastocatellia bacterium]